MRIQLSVWNGRGAIASVTDDDGLGSVELAINRNRKDAKGVASTAARKLRKAADAFERLAATEKPFSYDAQEALPNI